MPVGRVAASAVQRRARFEYFRREHRLRGVNVRVRCARPRSRGQPAFPIYGREAGAETARIGAKVIAAVKMAVGCVSTATRLQGMAVALGSKGHALLWPRCAAIACDGGHRLAVQLDRPYRKAPSLEEAQNESFVAEEVSSTAMSCRPFSIPEDTWHRMSRRVNAILLP